MIVNTSVIITLGPDILTYFGVRRRGSPSVFIRWRYNRLRVRSLTSVLRSSFIILSNPIDETIPS